MAKTKYLTAPPKTTGMPPGIPYIVANEAAERFSYYGMRSILVIFMTHYLLSASGQLQVMDEPDAKKWYHLFIASVYFFPLLGAIIADAFLGKYLTIISLSIVYCLGHLALALDTTRLGLAIGLGLIALGSGGIKPCVSAHVGDQFSEANKCLLPKVFSWFYFSINFGSAISTLLIPFLLEKYGPHVAFGTPGILMLLATFFFWLGRHKYAHIPPGGMAFVREAFSPTGLKSIGKLLVIYVFIAMFWSLYDQSSSSWVFQAEKMDRHWLGRDWLPAQIQAINPILILVYIPLFTYVIYPLINKVFPLTPLRKISIGFFVTAASFLIPAYVESKIVAGQTPHIIWQFFAYTLLIAGEIFVSITALEFSYTQAPKRMKSLIMGIFLASVTLGNVFTAAVNAFIKNPDKTSKLSGPSYYLFFAGAMFVAALLFIFFAARYKEQTYIQGEEQTSV
ncbi:MAG: proton-dependent oligopeptide transporter family [Pedosphaera sp.]|nr:proton-dependent oligopeptide transporter family [Pedosphaera sp.]